VNAKTRTLQMIEIIRVARRVAGARSAPDQLPEPSAVRVLQAAAFDAEGLPRLMSELLACYTEVSQPVSPPFSGPGSAAGGALRYRFLDHDVRLIKAVSTVAGFRSGTDVRWAISCIGELAEHAHQLESGSGEYGQPVKRDKAVSLAGGELLRRLGGGHLVCGRLNPAALRSAALRSPEAWLPMARLRPGAVGVLSAISRDAAEGDPAWAASASALSGLGVTPGRAAQVFTSVGPLIGNAARNLEVTPCAELVDQADRAPAIEDSAGVVLAICDLIALNSLSVE
jgi:hypothetical protein